MSHDKASSRTKRNNPGLIELNVNFYYGFKKNCDEQEYLDQGIQNQQTHPSCLGWQVLFLLWDFYVAGFWFLVLATSIEMKI